MNFVTRFAPSPTGLLHLGHAYSAFTVFDAARAAGGKFLLRIEDIDQGRVRAEFESAILEDLSWLGLSWEQPVWRQSERMHVYHQALDQLIARGLCYRCFRTRKEIMDAIASAPHEAGEVFRGEALPEPEERQRLKSGAAFAWRLSLNRARAELGEAYLSLSFQDETGTVRATPELLGDVVLARKDFPTSYHLSSALDDAAQGVSHVIRGEDLREAAHLHVLLQKLLQLPQPIYRHHRLLVGADGKRLSKRDGALSIRALREARKSPEEVRAMALG